MGHSRGAVLLQGSSLSAAIALRFLRQKLDPGVSMGQRLLVHKVPIAKSSKCTASDENGDARSQEHKAVPD